MRPLYETKEHLLQERNIASMIGHLWNCETRKLPITYHLDFILSRNRKALGFMEIKSRSNRSSSEVDRMGGYLINLSKIEKAKSLTKITGLPFFLVVEFSDGIFAARFNEIPNFDIFIGGRKDRNDWQDIEPVVLINMNLFKQLDWNKKVAAA